MPRARSRKLNRFERMLERVAATPAGGWFFVHVAHHVDPFLLRASKGRVSLAPGQPIALVTVKGAKSGVPRQTPLLFASDGDDIILLASNAGSTRHPAWYHNLLAHPDTVVEIGNETWPVRAHVATTDERQRILDHMKRTTRGVAAASNRTRRELPVVVLRRML